MAIEVASHLRTFAFDDEGDVLISPTLYGDDKYYFIRNTEDVLSVSGLYGVYKATVFGDKAVAREKLISLGYIEWNEGLHSFLHNGYRFDAVGMAEKALLYANNNGIGEPVTISIQDDVVIFEYADEYAPQYIPFQVAEDYWDHVAA